MKLTSSYHQNRQDDTGKLGGSVVKEREVSARLVGEFANDISTFKNTPMNIASKNDGDRSRYADTFDASFRKSDHEIMNDDSEEKCRLACFVAVDIPMLVYYISITGVYSIFLHRFVRERSIFYYFCGKRHKYRKTFSNSHHPSIFQVAVPWTPKARGTR